MFNVLLPSAIRRLRSGWVATIGWFGRRVGWESDMSVEKFIADNGEEVFKVVTPSGVTGYIPACVPREAIIKMRDKLLEGFGMSLEEYREYRKTRFKAPS